MEIVCPFIYETCPDSIKTQSHKEFHDEFVQTALRCHEAMLKRWMETDCNTLHLALLLKPQTTRLGSEFSSFSGPHRRHYASMVWKEWPNRTDMIQAIFSHFDLAMRNQTLNLLQDYHARYKKEHSMHLYLTQHLPLYLQSGNCIAPFHLTEKYIYSQRSLVVWNDEKMAININLSTKSSKVGRRKIHIPRRGMEIMECLPQLSSQLIGLCLNYIYPPVDTYNGDIFYY
jgi:hypothetical protein